VAGRADRRRAFAIINNAKIKSRLLAGRFVLRVGADHGPDRKDRSMRYMYLVSAVEDGKPPPPRLMEELDKMARQELASGRMISQGGLLPMVMGGAARIELRGKKVKVMDGPFTETKEVIGGFAIFEFATRDEAIASAVKFMEMHERYGEGWQGVCEMRPMFDDTHADGCAVSAAAQMA
jgi:hypothetical protein